MRYAALVAASADVAATRSRTAKVQRLADLLRASDPQEVGVVVAHLSGVVPQRRLGVGYRSLSSLPTPADSPTLTVAEVDEAFIALASAGGEGSTGERRSLLEHLMSRATADEQAFLRALMTGNLRQGALDGVMLPAIAAAYEVPDASVRRAAMLAGFAGPVAQAAATRGVEAVDAIGLVVGRPVRPMLASSEKTVAEAVARVGGGEVVIDGKLDGIRIQGHRRAGEVRIFTRSLDEITARVPEVVAAIAGLPGGDLVVDGEAILLRADGRPAPFQETGARTASTEGDADTPPLSTFLFDLLHLDGRDLLDEPFANRWELLAGLAPELLVPRVVTGDEAVAQAFFDELVASAHEGVVVKSLSALYAAGRRGSEWVKVKPVHTLDLVVLAVEYGSGRRRGLLSNIHLGARDPARGGFVMLGKTFKGMTDEMLAWQTERFRDLEVEDNGWVVTLRPEQVVEIAFDGLQRSSRYPGGLALRFARVLRYRDDKTADEADTIETVRALAGS